MMIAVQIGDEQELYEVLLVFQSIDSVFLVTCERLIGVAKKELDHRRARTDIDQIEQLIFVEISGLDLKPKRELIRMFWWNRWLYDEAAGMVRFSC